MGKGTEHPEKKWMTYRCGHIYNVGEKCPLHDACRDYAEYGIEECVRLKGFPFSVGEGCEFHSSCNFYKDGGLDGCIQRDMACQQGTKKEYGGVLMGFLLALAGIVLFSIIYFASMRSEFFIVGGCSLLILFCWYVSISERFVCANCGKNSKRFFLGLDEPVRPLRIPCPHCYERAYCKCVDEKPFLLKLTAAGLLVFGSWLLIDVFQPIVYIKGGVNMFGFGFVACIVAIAFLSGKFYSKTRIIPRKGGGYIAEKIPAFKVKFERAKDEIDDMKL